MEPVAAREHLKFLQPYKDRHCYILGSFERNVTLFSQQLRAINLLFLLDDTISVGEKHAPKCYVIVGGGVAGLTAACGAAMLGHHVTLLEKTSVLCHMQHGCDTRWVHPHLYDWPSQGSERPTAGLPIMDWRAGTASSVVAQLIHQLKQYKKLFGDRLTIVYEAGGISGGQEPIRCTYNEQRFQIECVGKNVNGGHWTGPARGDVLILATGFGVENTNGTQSYWRNDDLSQVTPMRKEPTVIAICGTGDGAIIDACRAKILNFRTDRFLKDLFKRKSNAEENKEIEYVRNKLENIKRTAEDPAKAHEIRLDLADLWNRLDDKGPWKTRFRKMLRTDTEVMIIGDLPREKFPNLESTSFLNAFIISFLMAQRSVKYEHGFYTEQHPTKNGYELRYKKPSDGSEATLRCDRIVARTGVDRAGMINNLVKLLAPMSTNARHARAQIKKIVASASTRPDASLSRQRLWPARGWRLTEHEEESDKGYIASFEALPPEGIGFATAFAAGLCGIISTRIREIHGDGGALPEHRLTVLRTVRYTDQEKLQQVAHYQGEMESDRKGRIARVFEMQGIAGLAARLGRSVVARKGTDFKEIMEKRLLFGLMGAKDIDGDVASWIAIPITGANGGTSLVVYIDSAVTGLFDHTPLQNQLLASCSTFARYLDSIVGVDSDFRVIVVDPAAPTKASEPEEAKKWLRHVEESESFTLLGRDKTPVMGALDRYDLYWEPEA